MVLFAWQIFGGHKKAGETEFHQVILKITPGIAQGSLLAVFGVVWCPKKVGLSCKVGASVSLSVSLAQLILKI